MNASRRNNFKWTLVKQKGTQLTSLPPGGQQSALLPAPLPGRRSWQPAACSSKPSQKPPPPQAAPSRPARLLYPQSCLPRSSHLQAALFEALLAVPNFFHPPGGQRSAPPPHILSPSPYHPLWLHWPKSCSLASEGRKCSQCSLCPWTSWCSDPQLDKSLASQPGHWVQTES